ncbi:MAG TPA: VOC family protein [Solirubrobacterales bacterium]|jgi:catechol 2,3-dioxygenase-like lactoylglutathione lyase family enzyme|nr:VOC family protein [Solirubrobacterales bacterium]
MLGESKATSGFAVSDLNKAREFYEGTLGLSVEVLDQEHGVTKLHLAEECDVLMYLSADMEPASYTMLNFEVDDIDAAVDGLGARGVSFERYEDFPQDDKGIVRGGPGPAIAWFKDPSGNVLSVLQQP